MREEVLNCLKAVCPDLDFEGSKSLVDDGVMDSFSIMQIIAALMETFEIEIDADDIVVENFNSLDGLTAMVERKK